MVAISLGAAVAGAAPIASAGAVVAVVPAALVDVRSRRLPDRLLATAAAVLLAGAAVEGRLLGGVDLAGLAIGAGVMAAPLFALHLLSPASMGFGDVKAAIVLGGAVGAVHWQLVLSALALAAGCAATAAVIARVRTIPFGPGLVSGAAIALAASTVFLPPAERPHTADLHRTVTAPSQEGAPRP